jgi:hypothetical protein
MVTKRKNAFIRQAKDITISSALTLGLLTTTLVPQGCSNEKEEYETVYTQGVQTHIKEIGWGEFKITDEQVVGENESKAIVTYLDGRVDTLSVAEAKKLVDQQVDSTRTGNTQNTVSSNHYHHGGGLGSVLMYGGLGYMLGRSMSQPTSPGVYATPEVYNRSQQTSSIVKNSRVSRPVSSSRGFFRSGSRSSRMGS